MTFKKQWITALTISALTVGGASAYAATNDDSSTTKQAKHGHHFEGMKKHDMTFLLKKMNLTQTEADAAREKGQSIADLAKAKGISFADYKKAELAAAKEQLASLVKSGDLTQTQADDMLKRQTERFSGVKSYDELKEKMPIGRHGGPGFFNESLIADVLKALGLSQSKFDAANQSLAAYAKAQSIKFADYKKALLAAQTSELNQLVKDGKMTKKQATEIKSRLTEEYKDAKSYDDLPDRGEHGKRGDHGPGGVFGDSTSAKFKAADQSLPEFAEANKIAYADFEKAVLTAQTAAIDQQVKDGKLTDKQAKQIKEHIQSRADAVSSYADLKKGPARDGGHGRGHGPGPGGDMPGAPDQGPDADPNASATSVDLAI